MSRGPCERERERERPAQVARSERKIQQVRNRFHRCVSETLNQALFGMQPLSVSVVAPNIELGSQMKSPSVTSAGKHHMPRELTILQAHDGRPIVSISPSIGAPLSHANSAYVRAAAPKSVQLVPSERLHFHARRGAMLSIQGTPHVLPSWGSSTRPLAEMPV